MKIVRILQGIIVIITIVLVGYWIWMDVEHGEETKLDEFFKTVNLSNFNVKLYDKASNYKYDITIINGIDYVIEFNDLKDLNHRYTIIAEGENKIYIDYSQKNIIKNKATDYDEVRESIETFLQRRLFCKRAYDIVDGKLYYVEYYDNIGKWEDYDVVSAFYFRNNKLEYKVDSHFGEYYIESIVNEIDETKFEIPEDAKDFKVQNPSID